MNAPVKQNRVFGGLRAFSSAVMSRIATLGNLVGTAYEGARDYYAIFGYKRNPTHEDFLARYLHQDIAQRILNAPVDATWTDPPEVTGTSESFTKAWAELVEEHEVFAQLARLDLFAGLGKYAIMVIGLDDGADLSRPVNSSRNNKVIYLQPYLEGSIKIKKIEESTSSPRFGLPTLYEVDPGDPTQDLNSTHIAKSNIVSNRVILVHYTRVLHLADKALEHPSVGHSRLEAIYNLLDDLMKVVGGSAETYWMAGNRGLQVDIDKDMDLNADDGEALEDEVEEYQHGLRRFIRSRGVEITNIGSDVADPRSTFDVIMSMISAATGIPKRLLIGVEAGQLASQQDRANWAVLIDERVKKWGRPKVLKPFINILQAANALPATKNVNMDWPDTYQMSPLERAQTSAQMARSMVNVAKALAVFRNEVDTHVFSIEEARRAVGFGRHMPIFEGPLPTDETFPPEKEDEPPPGNGPFGNPNA